MKSVEIVLRYQALLAGSIKRYSCFACVVDKILRLNLAIGVPIYFYSSLVQNCVNDYYLQFRG